MQPIRNGAGLGTLSVTVGEGRRGNIITMFSKWILSKIIHIKKLYLSLFRMPLVLCIYSLCRIKYML